MVDEAVRLFIMIVMIRQDIYIEAYKWRVTVYYAVTKMYCAEIMEDLYAIGCRGSNLDTAYENLREGKTDTGLTYSNYESRETVMVIARTSTPAQFLNSYDHERKHLEAHIADAYNLDPWGEEVAYLCGEIGQLLYPVSRKFMCECCKSKKNV